MSNFDGSSPYGKNFDNGGSINGNLTVSGDGSFENMTVTDTLTATTAIFVDELKISDAIIECGVDNPADLLNLGIVEHYKAGGVNKYAGLVRSHTTGKQYVLENLSTLPTPTGDITIEPKGTLVAETLESTTLNTETVHAMTMSNTIAPEITLHRKGATATPETALGDILGDVNFKGTNLSGTTDLGAKICAHATENFVIGQTGTGLRISTCDNTTITPTEKILCDTNGVKINGAFQLPLTSGTNTQVMTSNGTDATWAAAPSGNPFDQDLNKDDDVEFNKMELLNNPSFSNSYHHDWRGLFTHSKVARLGIGGLGTVSYRSNGNLTSPTTILAGQHITEDYYKGHDGSGYGDGVAIYTESSENWSVGNHGTRYKLDVTNNGATATTTKLTIDTAGVGINDTANQYYLPTTQGTNGQVLTRGASTGTTWTDQNFIENDNGSMQTMVGALLLDSSGDSELRVENGGSVGDNSYVTIDRRITSSDAVLRHTEMNVPSYKTGLAAGSYNYVIKNESSGVDLIKLVKSTDAIVLGSNTDIDGSLSCNAGGNKITLPTGQGLASQVITSNGSGGTTWEDTKSSFEILNLNRTDDVNNPELTFMRARGTVAVPTGVLSYNNIADIQFDGRDNAGVIRDSGSISVHALEDFTNTGFGTRMVFKTTNIGSTTKITKMTLSDDGVYINGGGTEYYLPTNRGTSGQVITSNGSGGTSWEDTPNLFENVNVKLFADYGHPKLTLTRARGTSASPTHILQNSSIGDIHFKGRNISGVDVEGATIDTHSTEIFTGTANGCKFVMKCTDNGTTTPVVKMELGTDGVSINTGVQKIAFPKLQATVPKQHMIDLLGDGVLTWRTLFIPYNYNYQSSTMSTSIVATGSPAIITTAGSEDTSVQITEGGTYRVTFDAEISLQGNIPQQLTARANYMATTLSGLSYTTQAISANMTLTAGYYKTVGAATITGTLTLSGSSTDIFVIYVNGALDMVANSSVVLSGGTVVKNVFFVVNGAFSTATPAIFRGNLFASTTVTFVGTNTFEGRCISLTGAIAYGSGTNPPSIGFYESSFIQFGVLFGYSTYTISGAISHTGPTATWAGDILTGNGAITGLGGYNGNFTSGVVEPSIRLELALYLNTSLLAVSKRCINAPVSDCHETSLCGNLAIGAGQTISVKAETMLSNTSVVIHNRNLNVQRVYVP
jgi:hypothetical protein